MKSKRQAKLIEIVRGNAVETQEELTELLCTAGFDVTQATVSRDIKELRVTKAHAQNGRYYYSVGDAGASRNKLKSIFRESVTFVQAAQNIVVLKTLPGLAPAACSALDAMQNLNMVGTLAGDDTAFLAMKDADAAEKLRAYIEEMLNA